MIDFKPGLYYFSCPYTRNREQNYQLAVQMAVELLKRGYVIFNPVVHNHATQNMINVHQYDLWLDTVDRRFFDCGVWTAIILAPGWEHSYGACQEKRWFEKANLPILYYEEIVKNERVIISTEVRRGRNPRYY